MEARVTRVIDGDTIEVVLPDGSTDTVRLLGVDTPETFSQNKPGEYGDITDTDCLGEWGQRATEFAIKQLDGRGVELALDPVAGERGTFGRLLAYIQVDSKDFGADLVQGGFARVYVEGVSRKEREYLAVESEARAARAGLWQCSDSTLVGPPATITDTPTRSDGDAQVVLECIFYDGRVPRSEADEYVQIVNPGDSPMNLLGWRLTDISEGYPSFTFPPYVLDPGESVRVYTNQHHPDSGGFTFAYGGGGGLEQQ